MRESLVEAYLIEQVEARGGTAEKFTSPGRRSVPDRLVCWPRTLGGDAFPTFERVAFVECKATGEPPSDAQARDHKRRRAMGFNVYVVDSYAAVDDFIRVEGFK